MIKILCRWHVFLTCIDMKRLFLIVIISVSVILAAFKQQQRLGSIHGRVIPLNAALNVWAVSDKDTAHAIVQNGEFELKQLKPGRYRVIAEGMHPYKVTTRPDVIVTDSLQVNIGDLILDQ